MKRIVRGKTTVCLLDDGRYVVSEHDVWLPGVYDSEEAAARAVALDPAVLHVLWFGTDESPEPVQTRVLTLDMVNAAGAPHTEGP